MPAGDAAGTTRSWKAGFGSKLRAAGASPHTNRLQLQDRLATRAQLTCAFEFGSRPVDAVLLGRSTTLYTTHPSSFARPVT